MTEKTEPQEGSESRGYYKVTSVDLGHFGFDFRLKGSLLSAFRGIGERLHLVNPKLEVNITTDPENRPPSIHVEEGTFDPSQPGGFRVGDIGINWGARPDSEE